ncbi:MAG: ribonuclease III [Acaryochloridaceae cyanobacterium SU_2_1]|nr:ribonuclease III [Acaryochloridaceae cyanobacterium SU_2_1]
MADCPPHRQQQLQKLIAHLGLPKTPSVNWGLLDIALTHPTASSTANYEQLEFVGDAVVKMVAALWLWELDPHGSVGEWSAIRSELVSDRILAELATSYGFTRFLQLGTSALKDSNGQESRLADAFEAVLGALYLSTHDLSLIQPWLQPLLHKQAELVRADPAHRNYKAALQEWTQAHYQQLPDYRVQDTQPLPGPDSSPEERFMAEVWLQNHCLGQGRGRSRKAAEKAAAQVAFLQIQTSESQPSQPSLPGSHRQLHNSDQLMI